MSGRIPHGLPDEALARLSHFVGIHLGLHFPQERWQDLERGAREACREFGTADIGRYVERLLSPAVTSADVHGLASHLIVSETYFFREQRSLEIFREHIVPSLTGSHGAAKRYLRVWSAGCATGEEPYSIAMLMSQMLPERNFTILATDVNARSLQKAAEGVYTEWSFRGTPPWVKARYFSATADGRWALDPSVKKMVTFSQSNLVEGTGAHSAGGMDVIFCRNVLMYFGAVAVRHAVRRLHCSLNTNGWLIVSPAETSQTLFAEFATVNFSGATLYRKAPAHAPAPVVSESPCAISETTAFAIAPAAIPDESPDSIAPRRVRDRSPGMLRLARWCANRGNLGEALRCCDRAIAADGTKSLGHYLRALILQEQGSLEEAARSLRRAIYLEPRFVIGHLTLGNLAIRRGRVKESAKHFANTIDLLASRGDGEILPESEGLTAGRLRTLIGERSRA